MIIIGITGPTGAGKTTALNVLEELGGHIIDADAVYHELLANDRELQRELEDRFGSLRDEHGVFQRKKLGTIVFADPEALAELSVITFRYIDRAIQNRLAQAEADGCPVAAIDAIRLFESGLAERCAATLAIVATPEIRVRRIMAREGISEEYAWSRVNAQEPDDFYTRQSDYALVNDCETAEEFARRAKALFALILEKHAQ